MSPKDRLTFQSKLLADKLKAGVQAGVKAVGFWGVSDQANVIQGESKTDQGGLLDDHNKLKLSYVGTRKGLLDGISTT